MSELMDKFGEYGLAGLVIVGLMYLIKFGFTQYKEITVTFTALTEKVQNDHREDRKEWHEAVNMKSELDKQSQERRDAALVASLDSLKDAIRDQNNRSRRSDV